MTYSDVIAAAIGGDGNIDPELHRVSLARVLMAVIVVECATANAQARSRGTQLQCKDWLTYDKFEVSANGRRAVFSRDHDEVTVSYELVPTSLLPYDARTTRVPLPSSLAQLKGVAQAVVERTLHLIFAA